MTSISDRARSWLTANPNLPATLGALVIKVGGAALSFIFSFLIARKLGASGTGGYALALSTATFGATIALFGLDYVALRSIAGSVRESKYAEARGLSRSAMLASCGIALAIGLFLIGAGDLLLNRVLDVGLDHMMIIVAGLAVVPIAFTRMAIVSLRGTGSVLGAQWFDGPQPMLVSVAILGCIIVTGATISTLGVTAMFFTVSAISGAIAFGVYQARIRHWPAAAPVAIKPLLAQGWQISFVVLSRGIVDWLVLVSLSSSHSVADVGQFRTAWQITTLVTIIINTFETVSGPRIAAAHRVKDSDQIRAIIRQSVFSMMALSAPLFIVMFAFPEWLLGLFGPEFPAAAPALRILALGQLVNIVSGPLGLVMLMTGEERWTARVSLASLVVLGGLCVTLIPALGLIGAALTTAIIIVLRTGTLFVLIKRLRLAG